jgi:pimeloyl-ACP methyl ester carboxylesterase
MDGDSPDHFRRREIALPGRGDGSMAVLDFGPRDRPADVVFLHANGFNALTYRTLLAPLGEYLRILAVDQRGHGATTLPAVAEGRTNWYDLRDDLVALLETLDLTDVVLSGHSMGGAASVMAAAAAPSRVRSLVLFDPVVMTSDTTAAARRGDLADSPLVAGARRRRALFTSRQAVMDAYRGRGAFRTWPEAMLQDYVAGGFKDTPDGEVTLACAPEWEASNFTSHAHDTVAAFEALKCPARILKAEIESTCRMDARMDALVASGAIAVEVLPGTTHFLPMERPEAVRAALTGATAPARG